MHLHANVCCSYCSIVCPLSIACFSLAREKGDSTEPPAYGPVLYTHPALSRSTFCPLCLSVYFLYTGGVPIGSIGGIQSDSPGEVLPGEMPLNIPLQLHVKQTNTGTHNYGFHIYTCRYKEVISEQLYYLRSFIGCICCHFHPV